LFSWHISFVHRGPWKNHCRFEIGGKRCGGFAAYTVFCKHIDGFVQFFHHPGVLAKHLGHKSGMRGWFIALTAGILSHGPMYAWYSMIEDLRRHGMRDGLIAAFFYARAIKLPLLPLMVAYFGLDFTVILSCLTILAAWGQGVAIDRLGQES